MSDITIENTTRNEIAELSKKLILPEDEIGKMAAGLRGPLESLNNKVQAALEALGNNSSNPAFLADYQTATSQYNVYRQLASSAIKEKRDLDLAIIRNIG